MPLRTVCGAECQVTSSGAGGVNYRHWTRSLPGNAGTPAVVSSPVRSGDYAFKFQSESGGGCSLSSSADAGDDSLYPYMRAYIQVPDTTPAANTKVVWANTSTDGRMGVQLSSSGVLRAFITDQTGTAYAYSTTNNISISADTWYGVEFTGDTAGTTHTLKWRVWTEGGGWSTSETVTQTNCVELSSSLSWIGIFGAGQADFIVYIDDVAYGRQDAIDELYDDTGTNGFDGYVLRYNPVSDGTHTFDSSADFQYDESTGISPSATDTYSYVDDDDMEASTSFINNTLGGSTDEAIIWDLDTPASSVASFRGVVGVSHFDQDGSNSGAWLELMYPALDEGEDDKTNIVGGGNVTLGVAEQLIGTIADATTLQTTDQLAGAYFRFRINNTGYLTKLYAAAIEVEWDSPNPGGPVHAVSPTDDVTTTGWTSTPLWSKVDDDPDSPDATVITGTAS